MAFRPGAGIRALRFAVFPSTGKNREDIILVRLKGKVNHKPCASLTAKTKKEAKDKRKK